MYKKLKIPNIFFAATAVLFFCISLVFASPAVVSAAGCAGTQAPDGADCTAIPIGCPGSVTQGPLQPGVTLKCPYSPAAGTNYTCPTGVTCTFADNNNAGTPKQPSALDTPSKDQALEPGADCNDIANDAAKCSLISDYLNPFIKVLSALVGVAVTIAIVYGGIQYASSGGDPQKAAAAKNRIRNAIIALITYIFLFALLNFLIPGGLV